MKFKSVFPLLASVVLIFNSGCVSPKTWSKEEIRYESREEGLTRLTLSALGDMAERAEVFIPSQDKWVFVQQKGYFDHYTIRNINHVKRLRKYGQIEFYHTHPGLPLASNEEIIENIFPSARDFITLGPYKSDITTAAISPFCITYFENTRRITSSDLNRFDSDISKISKCETNAFRLIDGRFKYERNGMKFEVSPR